MATSEQVEMINRSGFDDQDAVERNKGEIEKICQAPEEERAYITEAMFKLKPTGRWIELCTAAFPPMDQQTLEYTSCESAYKLNSLLDKRLENYTSGAEVSGEITFVRTTGRTENYCPLIKNSTTTTAGEPIPYPSTSSTVPPIIQPILTTTTGSGTTTEYSQIVTGNVAPIWFIITSLIFLFIIACAIPGSFYFAHRFIESRVTQSRELLLQRRGTPLPSAHSLRKSGFRGKGISGMHDIELNEVVTDDV